MKKLTILVLGILMIVYSCRKRTSVSVAANPMIIPWNMTNLMPARPITLIGYSKLNVAGLLVACKLSGSITDTAGLPGLYTSNWEAASFMSGVPYQYIADVSTSSVNSAPLSDGDFPGLYRRFDSVQIWNEGSSNHWHISGSDSIPLIDTSVSGTMPVFTGTLPVTISRTSGFSFTFNSSNTVNGDSAFVVLYDGFAPISSNVTNANGGTAVISASLLSTAENCSSCSLTRLPGDPFRYSGGLIMIVIYNHSIYTIGGKKFAFVKQREILGIVNFL